jgi:REP element-mobilizing transposase RayT
MPRLSRFKVEGGAAWYHLHARAAGRSGEFPLADAICRRKLLDLMKFYERAYLCVVAAFCVMGNHWHLVMRFDEPRKLSPAELLRRARSIYPGRAGKELLAAWGPAQWERFAERICDVSEFMRNVQAAFARWYNRTFDRVGRFWADRFKSTVLGDERAVLDCMTYVELNPVRAGIVERPEDYEGSSFHLREIGEGDFLLPLREILGGRSEKRALAEYRARLYWRGSVPTREGAARIPERVMREEERRGFARRGALLKRLRYFSEGVVVGGEEFVRQQITDLRRTGRYLRRKHPVAQLKGVHFSLREQRSHAAVP